MLIPFFLLPWLLAGFLTLATCGGPGPTPRGCSRGRRPAAAPRSCRVRLHARACPPPPSRACSACAQLPGGCILLATPPSGCLFQLLAPHAHAPCRAPPARPHACLPAVEGRTHNVQVHYLEAPASDYIQAAVETAVNIHREDLPGDILIFLTGQDECEAGEPGAGCRGIPSAARCGCRGGARRWGVRAMQPTRAAGASCARRCCAWAPVGAAAASPVPRPCARWP